MASGIPDRLKINRKWLLSNTVIPLALLIAAWVTVGDLATHPNNLPGIDTYWHVSLIDEAYSGPALVTTRNRRNQKRLIEKIIGIPPNNRCNSCGKVLRALAILSLQRRSNGMCGCFFESINELR